MSVSKEALPLDTRDSVRSCDSRGHKGSLSIPPISTIDLSATKLDHYFEASGRNCVAAWGRGGFLHG